ncbi:MAG: putative metal-dependent hydrolase, partial [Candidatus Marinamargulisbacteria bacterium]
SFDEGSPMPYLGHSYPLKFFTGPKKKIYFCESQVMLETPTEPGSLSPEKIQTDLSKWYKIMARDIIEDRVGIFAEIMAVSPKDIRIKSQKRAWGSCSSKQNLNFNWKLVLTPLAVLDYVVIHELAHLKHFNHSASFWEFVAHHCPAYKTHMTWLKTHGPFLWEDEDR